MYKTRKNQILLYLVLFFLVDNSTIAGTWEYTESMSERRIWHSATILNDDKIIIAGGFNSNGSNLNYLSSCEVFDPFTCTWNNTGSLNNARPNHKAVLLSNGMVLVVGGHAGGTNFLSSCELFNPNYGTWTITDDMSYKRENHTLTILNSGEVLVSGGYYYDNNYIRHWLSSCEIYDTLTNTWSEINSMNNSRSIHTSSLLQNGKVLVTGGEGGNSYELSSCEIFDPSTGNWTFTGSLNTPRFYHTATVLENGKILVIGGWKDNYLYSCEIYDPDTGVWSYTGSMNIARSRHTAVLLPSGGVLVSGGYNDNSLSSCEVYDPISGNWSIDETMNINRYYHTATHLPNGKIIITGGTTNNEELSSCEIYNWLYITYPNSGENFIGGSIDTVKWTNDYYDGSWNFRVLFSHDGGVNYPDTIATMLSIDDTYTILEFPKINSNTCRFKVQLLDTLNNVLGEDESDGDFSIQFCTEILSPNGAENWKSGSTQSIIWSTIGLGFNYYNLMCSYDGGISYPETIATDISNSDSTYNWIIPEITSDSVRVKIQMIGSESQVLAEDWSDGNFQIDATPPAAITDLQVTERTYNNITIKWTAPGDDSLSGGQAAEYDIRYYLSPITETNWGSATQCDDEPTPSWPGGYQTFTVTNLLTDTLYYFAIKTRDEHYHWSGLSNVAFGLTKPYPVLASSQYPMFHYDEQHTGRSPYYGPLSNNIKWFFATYYTVSSSPIVGPDGTIYFSSENDTLYAVNTDGTKKWANAINSSTKSSPAIAIDSTIYIGTDDGMLVAYGYNGNVKWEYGASGSIISSPAIGTDGAVYFGSTNDTLYSVNADGTLKWTFSTDGPIYSSPAISPDGIVYIGSNDHNLYAIHPDGSLDWSVNSPAEIMSSPAVDISTGVIYVGSSNGKLYAVNPNGTIGWTYTTGDTITSSPAIGADGAIFFGSYDGKVYGLNSDGDLIWSYETDGKVRSSPVIDARGYVYIGSDDATLYCFDGSDGTVVWSGVTGDKVTSSPAISANSTVYVGSYDGRLYAFGTTAPVTLLSPNGGEEWIKNTLHDILWSTTGTIVNIKLSYSKDSGNSYTPISDSEIDDGIYSWTLPDIISSTCRVKVVAFDAGGDSAWDASDADFSIISDTTIVSVWPGDLDNNGVVEATDVLPLAIHWRKTGLSRSDASYSWEGQEITPWSDIAATYADANGDGEVNITDLLTICVNWGKTHTVSTVLANYDEEFDVNKHYEVLNVIYQEVKNADSGPRFEIRLYLEKLLGIRIPEDYNLSQNYPNPFNSETVIKYQLPKAGRVELTVYNLMGEVIKELVNENKDSGFYEVIWDGTNTVGNQVSSGVYFYYVRVNEFRSIKKIIIIK